MCCVHTLDAQIDSLQLQKTIQKPDTIPIAKKKKEIPLDSFPQNEETKAETDRNSTNSQTRQGSLDSIIISEDSFDDEIDFGSNDTMWFDHPNKQVHLYGEAFVNYTGLTVKGGYIIYDFERNIAHAFSTVDSLGIKSQNAEFSDGTNKFKYRELKYNFKSQKGIVYDAISQEGDIYLHGALTKFISKDSLHIDDVIFNKNALITTCDLENPHYGIRTRKLKVIPNKLAIIGPAQLEIGGIPTPLFLPFGFFPIIKGRRSGLILPKDYEYSPKWGFGFREFGYYFPINDYLDLQVTADVYTRGTWGLRVRSNYKKRYKYNGTINLGYSFRKTESESSTAINIEKSFKIAITHNQDSKAHPYKKFGGNINITTNSFDQINFNDAASILTNTYNSNFSFSNSMPGTPFTFSAGFSHSQNTQTHKMTFNLPDVNLRMSTVYPFKNKNRGGNKEKWYEKISIQYNTRFKNVLNATDTTLFTSETLANARFGILHNAKTSASYRVFKYFNLTQNFNYEEVWHFRTIEQTFDPTIVINEETKDTTYGSVIKDTITGFVPFRKFSTSLSLNTSISGTIQFKKGWLRGIRHVIKPSISLNFSPDIKQKYTEVVDTDTRPDFNDPLEYSPFGLSVFGSPLLRGKQMSIGYSFNNIFEAKYYSKKDSTTKKLKLFENIVVNGNYNFAADSLKWSAVNMSATTRFFKGITTVSISASFDPYLEENGRRINKTVWSDRNRLLRFERAELRVNTSFTIKQIRDLFGGGKSSKSRSRSGSNISGNISKSADSEHILDILDNFRIRHSFTYTANQNNGVDTSFVRVNSIYTQGIIPLSRNWKLRVGNFGYDFKAGKLTYPDIGLTRDLHCWELNFNWQPFNGTYNFFIGVKSSSLNFIKYNYRQNNVDSIRRF